MRFVRVPTPAIAVLATCLLLGCSGPEYLVGMDEEVAFLGDHLVPIEAVDGPLYYWGAGERGLERADIPPEPTEGMAAIVASAQYPESALRRCAEGHVVVRFVVDEEGRVVAAEPAETVDPDLDVAATVAVARGTFTPALKDGEPVKVVTRIPITFNPPASSCAARASQEADWRYR